MANNKKFFYLLLFLLLITKGCGCEQDPDDDGYIEFPCAEIDKVNKTFKFEVYVKYSSNNEPIQSKGQVQLGYSFRDYTFKYKRGNLCRYSTTKSINHEAINIDQNGKVIFNIGEFEFDNEHDSVVFHIWVSLPNSTKIDQKINKKMIPVTFKSPESSVLFFSYKSEYDLDL